MIVRMYASVRVRVENDVGQSRWYLVRCIGADEHATWFCMVDVCVQRHAHCPGGCLIVQNVDVSGAVHRARQSRMKVTRVIVLARRSDESDLCSVIG